MTKMESFTSPKLDMTSFDGLGVILLYRIDYQPVQETSPRETDLEAFLAIVNQTVLEHIYSLSMDQLLVKPEYNDAPIADMLGNDILEKLKKTTGHASYQVLAFHIVNWEVDVRSVELRRNFTPRLTGDISTDAPPPDARKKKKGKG